MGTGSREWGVQIGREQDSFPGRRTLLFGRWFSYRGQAVVHLQSFLMNIDEGFFLELTCSWLSLKGRAFNQAYFLVLYVIFLEDKLIQLPENKEFVTLLEWEADLELKNCCCRVCLINSDGFWWFLLNFWLMARPNLSRKKMQNSRALNICREMLTQDTDTRHADEWTNQIQI